MDDSQMQHTTKQGTSIPPKPVSVLAHHHHHHQHGHSFNNKATLVSVLPPLPNDSQEKQEEEAREQPAATTYSHDNSIKQCQQEHSSPHATSTSTTSALPNHNIQHQPAAIYPHSQELKNININEYEHHGSHLHLNLLSPESSTLQKIILVQSVVRRWLVKRRYQLIAKNFRIRCEVVKEIVMSEKRYNKQLLTMIEVFLVPLREALASQTNSSNSEEGDEEEEDEGEKSNEEDEDEDEDEEDDTDDDEDEDEDELDEEEEETRQKKKKKKKKGKDEKDVGYTEDDIFHIFSHLETIHNLSNVLIALLEERYAHGWRAHRTLGDLFVQIGPFLKTLKQYVENYDNALQTLERLKEESGIFSGFIEEMEEDARCLSLDLASLLIVPVQRVPRYILLLETLKQNTPRHHLDDPLLTQAITELKKVASFINKGIGEGGEKDIGVLTYLQSLADAQCTRHVQIIQSHRKMIKHGTLSKKSLRDGESSTRELYLLTDLLVVVSDIMNVVSLQRIDKIVPLVTATIIDNNLPAGDSASFMIASPIKTFLFVCDDMQVKEEWMSSIQTAISNLLQAHPNNAKLRQEWSVDYRNNEWQVTRAQEQVQEEESDHKGVSQLAQLQKLLTLSNKGNIRIKKACFGLVEEVFGTNMQEQDKCPHYTPESTFLSFPASEKLMWLISMTGFITLANKGYSMILLCAHKRACGIENEKHRTGKYYDLLPGEVKKFPFRGHWTIEVMGGNCAELQVVSFSPSNGDSLPNLLGMVGKVMKVFTK